MIVISGALVAVSLVLLVLGVTRSDINLVYGCIVVSLVSLVFLVLGIIQRRGKVLPGAEASAAVALDASARQFHKPGTEHDDPPQQQAADGQGGVPVPGEASPGDADAREAVVSDVPPAEEPDVTGAVAVAGIVLVVANRPRYHVDGCRYLAGTQAQEVDLLDAREAGFTPCGVCRPNAQLARSGGEASPATDPRPAVEPAAAAPQSALRESEPIRSPRVGAAEPDPEVPAALGTGGAAAEDVVVVPDRNRYHRAQCRHVRDAVGAETLSTAQAGRQGYSACGVCKP